MSGGNGSTGPSKGALANLRHVRMAQEKVAQANQDLHEPPQGYPLPAPVKRTALIAPQAFEAVPSRTQIASQKKGS